MFTSPHMCVHTFTSPQTHFPPARTRTHTHAHTLFKASAPMALPLPTQRLPGADSGVLLAVQGGHWAVKGPLLSMPPAAAGVPLPYCLFGNSHLQSQVQVPFWSSFCLPWETLGQELGHSGATATCPWAQVICFSTGLCLKESICVNEHLLVPLGCQDYKQMR